MFVVTGSPRSYSRAVARLLHYSGITMWDSRKVERTCEDKKMYRCWVELKQGSHPDLHLRNPHLYPYCPLPNDVEIAQKCLQKHRAAGFKSPQASIAWPTWRKALPPGSLVLLTNRNRRETVRSYYKHITRQKRGTINESPAYRNALYDWYEQRKQEIREQWNHVIDVDCDVLISGDQAYRDQLVEQLTPYTGKRTWHFDTIKPRR